MSRIAKELLTYSRNISCMQR